ncbi:MAG: glycosyltransferase family 2 protein [Sphingobacteriales bacterium]|nr:MAG: glycosyltransferase family 2 protein [Sphingobacteriales bacterium]
MKVSIIIPTYNRASYLQTTLVSITKQVFNRNGFEIIVIDNGSSDNTNEVCRRYSEYFKNFIYYFDPTPGLLTGRHKGAELSTGEVLSFIDDDVELNKYWLKGVATAFVENQDVQLVTGPNLPKYEISPPKWLNAFWTSTPYGGRCCTWLSLLNLGSKQLIVDPMYVWCLNFSIRKSIFCQLGGFHPDNIPPQLQQFQGDGETGLALKAKRMNYTAVYTPLAKVYHHVPENRMTLEYFEKRAFYQGVCDSYSSIRREHKLYPAEDKVAVIENKKSRSPVKRLINKLGRIVFNRRREKDSKMVNQIHELVQIKYNEGFQFHQKAFKEQEIVRDWILRENYWDYKLPTYG